MVRIHTSQTILTVLIFIVKTFTMNIRQIIAEAIDKAVMVSYADEIKRCQGVYGLDPSPIATITGASMFVNTLNDFAWQVEDAIRTNNYRPSTPGSGSRKTQQLLNPQQVTNKSDRGLFDKAVNCTADRTNDMYNYTRQAGLNGLDPVIGGMVTSFQNAYNAGREKLDPNTYNQQQQQQQQQKQPVRRQRRRKTGIDLTTLMGEDYRTLLTNYNTVNQYNPGILYRVNGLKKLMETLAEIKNALSRS